MIFLTWVVFFLLVFFLRKFAWAPILRVLDEREDKIRRSVEEAERIRLEMERIHQKEEEILSRAQAKGKDIIDQARHAAADNAGVIVGRAKEEARILLENAQREIRAEVEKAKYTLREQSIRMTVDLTKKLIQADMTDDRHRALVDRFINET